MNILPYDPKLEDAVIGAMIVEPVSIASVIHMLSVSHFYQPINADIFKCIKSLFDSNDIVDLVTINYKAKELKLNINPSDIAELSFKASSAANIEYHCALLSQFYVKRKAIEIGNTLVARSFQPDTDGFENIGQCTTDIFNLTNSVMKKQLTKFSDGVKKVLSDLETPFSKDGIQTGFPDIDRMLGGLQPSDLVVLAARPGMGKTALLCSMARFISGNGIGVGLFSLEMSTDQIVKRMMSAEANIPSSNFRTAEFAEREWQRIHSVDDSFYNLPIMIDDTPSPALTEINAKARQMYAMGCKVIFVDYLQLIKTQNKFRQEEVSEVARGLKNLAKTLSIPVVALAQLGRKVEERSDKKPQLSDLRESGEIENSADSVGFLLRPEYYGLDTFRYNNEEIDSKGKAVIEFQKNRHGATGKTLINFINELTKFTA